MVDSRLSPPPNNKLLASRAGPERSSRRHQTLSNEVNEGEYPMADVKIEVRENGPLRFTGPITITDKDGKAYSVPDGEIVSFCRCGLSQNKPFCDGAHRDGGFQGDSVAR